MLFARRLVYVVRLTALCLIPLLFSHFDLELRAAVMHDILGKHYTHSFTHQHNLKGLLYRFL